MPVLRRTYRKHRIMLTVSLLIICSAGLSEVFAQMVAGEKIPEYEEVFGVKFGIRQPHFTAHMTASSIPGNILHPGEQPSFTIQIVNNLDQPIKQAGKVDVIEYGTRGRPGDIWIPLMFRIAEHKPVTIEVDIPPKGFQDVAFSPAIPNDHFGSYGLVLDLGDHGREVVAACVRTYAASTERLQYPKMSLDHLPHDVLRRLGVQAIRMGVGYVPTAHRDFQRRMDELDASLKDLAANNVTVLLMVGAGPGDQPLGRARPHLNDDNVMLPTKTDMAWLPSLDADFQKWVADVAGKYGWPNGPVTAFSLWNEPWEGLSISGWGADMPRYREIYTAMAKGVVQARDAAKVDVLITGCDSSSNTWDKLLGDGTETFLPWLDACTIHYQGMMPPIGYKLWERPGNPRGRVKIWDTESWVANTDDRVAAVIATNRAAGYDRSMGVFHGNICESVRFVKQVKDGKPERMETVQAYSVACAIGAAQRFIGERAFRELLFQKGLPWVMLFDGLNGNPDDGTVVIVGDIGEAFGAQNVLFRTVRGLKEMQEKEAIRAKLAALPADSPDRAQLETDLRAYGVLSDASLTLADGGGMLRLFDFYGNRVPSNGGEIVVPLDSRGFFLRPNGEKGSFDKLVAAIRAARIEGLEPVEVIVHDMLAPIAAKPSLRLEVTNILNRPVEGALSVKLGGLQVQAPPRLALAAHETKNVDIKITGGAAVPSNTYPLSLAFDAGKDGKATHYEDVHVNLIAKRTVKVDGKLDDWGGVLPQTVRADEKAALSLTESAWFPFKQFDDSIEKGLANGYLAYDDKFFYFAAKAADNTVEEGMYRFETRNDDDFYYPEVCYNVDMANSYIKVEAEFDAKENSPQLPEGNGRSTVVWENDKLVRAFAIDLDLPADRLTQVAFHFPPYDMHPNGFRVSVFDREKNRRLDQQHINKLWDGVYVVYNLAGKVRVRIGDVGDWYRVRLGGFFFDPAKAQDTIKDGIYAKLVTQDWDTHGNWRGVYGADGYHVFAAPAKYPDYAKVDVPETFLKEELKWPEGVRRYSYRRYPELPSGNSPNHDNVQIAFNALPDGADGRLPNPPGTMPRFTGYNCTDYEWALNKVAERFGGGVEIWRLDVPGMPRKHFYPRQPKSPFDGPVKSGRLVVAHEGNTRIVEAAIPWSEMPHVKKLLDAGKTVKFSFRVNDNAGRSCMELARERSVSKRNSHAFHCDWMEHWANEVEFAFEK